tara:strand:+ start:374 stop:619 length:246 start_codon:yes stop_codon:yes gene_type:complete
VPLAFVLIRFFFGSAIVPPVWHYKQNQENNNQEAKSTFFLHCVKQDHNRVYISPVFDALRKYGTICHRSGDVFFFNKETPT